MKSKPKIQEEMFPIIKSYQSYKGTVNQFLKSHEGVTKSTFNYWLTKYRKTKKPISHNPTFIKFQPKHVQNKFNSTLSIHLPNGIRITTEQPITPELITNLSKVSA